MVTFAAMSEGVFCVDKAMKRRIIFLLLALSAVFAMGCGSDGNEGYDPNADANAQLDEALAMAQQRGKNVVVQVGGSWCPWCVRLHKLLTSDAELRGRMENDYVWVQVYYGKDNANASAISRLGDLKGYGYPVLVVLSPNGEVLHRQNTGELEEGEGYSKARLLAFMDQHKELKVVGKEAVPVEKAVAE